MPKTHWVLLGCGPEPASAAAPALSHTPQPTPCRRPARSAPRTWVAATRSRAQPYAWRVCPVSQPSSASAAASCTPVDPARLLRPGTEHRADPHSRGPRGAAEAPGDAGGGRTGSGKMGPGTVHGGGGGDAGLQRGAQVSRHPCPISPEPQLLVQSPREPSREQLAPSPSLDQPQQAWGLRNPGALAQPAGEPPVGRPIRATGVPSVV